MSSSVSSSSTSANLTAAKLFDCSGRVAVVTGGGTGIGLMQAQTLAANGAKVYIVGRRLESLQNAASTHGTPAALDNSGGSMIPLQADITSKDSIADLVKRISEKESAIHILINNAGISGPKSSIEKGDESAEALSRELAEESFEGWTDVWNTNVASYFFTSVAFLPLLSAATKAIHGYSGCIINTSSISGITRTSQHHMAYNASKAATIQLTTMLGQEFSRSGVKVRVNSIAPGIFASEMTTDGSGPDQKSFIDAEGGQWGEKKGVPAGRPGKEEDMAAAVLCCACNQYMNNAILVVDGGYLLRNG